MAGRPKTYDDDRVQTKIRLPRVLHERAKTDAENRGISLTRRMEIALENDLAPKDDRGPRLESASEISHPDPSTEKKPRLQKH